jgi:hypothetical protein
MAFLSKEKITTKVDYLKKTFRWSDAEVSIASTRAPMLLRRSKDMLQRRSQFLISEVGLEPVYIAHRPVIICLSLEGRLKPRHYVLKFHKEKKILDRGWSFCTAVMKTTMFSWRSTYALTRKLCRTLLKTIQPLAEGKCRLISDLHEPRTAIKFCYCRWGLKF